MAEKKNQHFVPKMYLRLFGDPGGRSIGVFHIATGRHFPNASIADQAAKPWLYDHDGTVEDTFGVIEGRAAPILRTILADDRVPATRTVSFHRLLTFVILQRERTLAAVAELNARTDAYVKAFLRHQYPDQENLDRLDRVTIRRTAAMADSLLTAHLGMPLLYDLKAKLIANVSGRAFFTSDAPVILHNRLFEGTGAPALGYGSQGLMVLVPIGPWRAVLLYDSRAYEVGSRASHLVRLVNPAHARLVNDLQWEAAESCLYVSRETAAPELAEDRERWLKPRTKCKILLSNQIVRDDDREKRVRVGAGRALSTVRLDLPFVHIRLPPPGRWQEGTVPAMRDPAWVDYVTNLAEMVQDELLDYTDFSKQTLFAYRQRNR